MQIKTKFINKDLSAVSYLSGNETRLKLIRNHDNSIIEEDITRIRLQIDGVIAEKEGKNKNVYFDFQGNPVDFLIEGLPIIKNIMPTQKNSASTRRVIYSKSNNVLRKSLQVA